MPASLRVPILALFFLVVLGAAAEAGEVTLVNGDKLNGRVWRTGETLNIDHPVLGLIRLEPGHYEAAVLDPAAQAATAPVVTARPVPVCADPADPAPARALLCDCPAPVNVDLAPKCKSPFEFATTFGLALDGGNTDKQAVNLDVDAAYEWQRINRLSLRSRNFYERANGIQTEGKYYTMLRYEREVSARGYVFGNWISTRDDFADILLRTGWVVGYGHHFIKRENESLKAEIGAGAAYEDRKGVPDFTTGAAYAGAWYKRTFKDGDYVQAGAWVIPYFDHVGRSPSQLELRYGHPIREHLDITASFLLDYVPDPPLGLRKQDTKFVLGLRWHPTGK